MASQYILERSKNVVLVEPSSPVNNEKCCNISRNKISLFKRYKKSSYKNNNNNQQIDMAPRFKYKSNFPRKDIEKVRELLTLERSSQTKDEYQFWTPDYERMLEDDWLVSRFLLRGSKASLKHQSSPSSSSSSSSSPSSSNEDLNESSEDEQQNLVLIYTMELVRACAKFRRDYRVNALTSPSEFPEEWIRVNGLFNFKPDFAGNPTIYLRCCLHKPKLIETKESRQQFKRLLLYTLEKCDQDLYNNSGKGVCCIFDMSEATFENIDLELVSWMIKSFKSCSPKLLAYVIVYNLPWFFSATFKLLTTTLMSNSKQCLKFVYADEILQYVEYNNLPDYIRKAIDDRN